MTLAKYDSIYFLGIGGIGMSARARWFLRQGLRVAGYDRTATTLTAALENEGMNVHYDDNVESIPSDVRNNPEATLVIFTPAIPKDHREHAYLKAKVFTIMIRTEV